MFLTACLVTAAFAGCATDVGASNDQLTLSRQIRVHFDSENLNARSDDVYDYVEAAFVVRVNGDPIVPATATIAYQDKEGRTVTRPLSDFTSLTSLTKGTEVRVGDANISSEAVLVVAGKEVASRARPHTEWWNVGGYPIGVKMTPGSALGYKMTGSGSESFTLTDLKGKGDMAEDFVVDRLAASFGVRFDGTMEVGLGSTPASVVAEHEHSAYPLDWRSKGHITLSASADATGRNLTTGRAITAGAQLTPDTGIDFDALGRVWWNVSGSPVRSDVSGGNWSSKVDATGWLTGAPELDSSFSCAGKAKADACHLTEIPKDVKSGAGTIPSDTTNLDTFPWDVDPEVVANLTRFLDEDLVPGDELRFDVDVDSAKLDGWSPSDGPQSFHITGAAVLRADDFEKVTVAAGSFDALKVVERIDMTIDAGATEQSGKVVLKPFILQERFVDTTFWLQKDTFVPLRIEQTIPFDLNKVVDTAIDNLGEGAWDDAPIEKLTGQNVDAKVEATSAIELTRNVDGARFSPFVVIASFHGLGALPGFAYASSLGRSMGSPVPPYASPTPTYGYDGYGSDASAPISMGLASRGAITGGTTKEYVVSSASSGLTYGGLAFTIDDAWLDYGDAAPAWCLVSGAGCVDLSEVYGADVTAGDVLRFTSAGISGTKLAVLDGASGDTVLTLTIA